MKNTKYLATVDVGGGKAVKSYSKNKVTVKKQLYCNRNVSKVTVNT